MTTVSSEDILIDRLECKLEVLERKLRLLNEKYGDLSLKEYLEPKEVCDILNISLRTLNNYRIGRRVNFYQIGNTVRYKPEDILSLLHNP